MQKTTQKTKLKTRFLQSIGVATIAFTFQACYGAPRDFGHDKLVLGVVTDKHGELIERVRVTINDSIQYTYTDLDGSFRLHVPTDSIYNITLECEGYISKDTVVAVDDPYGRQAVIDLQVLQLEGNNQ